METGYRANKNLKKLCKLSDREVSLADEGGQLCHQTGTLGATSTSSVSILRGSPSEVPVSLLGGAYCVSLAGLEFPR